MRAEQAPSRNDGGNPAASPNNGKQRSDIGNISENALDKGRRRRQLIFIARLLSYCEFAFKARDLKSSPYTRGQRQQQPGQQSGREKCKSNQDEWRLPRHACSEIERCILRIGNGQN